MPGKFFLNSNGTFALGNDGNSLIRDSNGNCEECGCGSDSPDPSMYHLCICGIQVPFSIEDGGEPFAFNLGTQCCCECPDTHPVELADVRGTVTRSGNDLTITLQAFCSSGESQPVPITITLPSGIAPADTKELSWFISDGFGCDIIGVIGNQQAGEQECETPTCGCDIGPHVCLCGSIFGPLQESEEIGFSLDGCCCCCPDGTKATINGSITKTEVGVRIEGTVDCTGDGTSDPFDVEIPYDCEGDKVPIDIDISGLDCNITGCIGAEEEVLPCEVPDCDCPPDPNPCIDGCRVVLPSHTHISNFGWWDVSACTFDPATGDWTVEFKLNSNAGPSGGSNAMFVFESSGTEIVTATHGTIDGPGPGDWDYNGPQLPVGTVIGFTGTGNPIQNINGQCSGGASFGGVALTMPSVVFGAEPC